MLEVSFSHCTTWLPTNLQKSFIIFYNPPLVYDRNDSHGTISAVHFIKITFFNLLLIIKLNRRKVNLIVAIEYGSLDKSNNIDRPQHRFLGTGSRAASRRDPLHPPCTHGTVITRSFSPVNSLVNLSPGSPRRTPCGKRVEKDFGRIISSANGVVNPVGAAQRRFYGNGSSRSSQEVARYLYQWISLDRFQC